VKRLIRWLYSHAHPVCSHRTCHSNGHSKARSSARVRNFCEPLDSRLMLSTLSIDAAGALAYSATPTIANDLTISIVSTLYVFSESGESINVIGAGSAGCGGSGTGVVACPSSAIQSLHIDLGDGNDKLTAALEDPSTILGGLGDDTLNAAAATAPVNIDGGIGNDSATGGSANDSLAGDIGNDTLDAGSGDDTVSGGVGDDNLTGGQGSDRVVETSDTVFLLSNTSLSGIGSDTLNGFEEARLTGGAGNNTLDASAFTGNVTLNGGAGNDSLAGAQGNDRLLGGEGNDTISAGLGNDVLVGGRGNDTLDGGGGTDAVDHSASPNGVRVNLKQRKSGGEGTDRLLAIEGAIGSEFNDVLIGNNLANLLIGGGGKDRINGQGGEDTLHGGDDEDILQGGAGNDIVVGGAGNDALIGHLGRDLLIGGTGNDILIGTNDADILITGQTDHDANDTALAAIMFEWTAPRSYATRRNNVRDGSGSVDRVNASFFLSQTTVHEDATVDRVSGRTEEDWFFGCTLGPKKDSFTDRLDDEFFEELCS
jgi:Ca2+-binding RTX toxin-like protein